MKVVFHLSSPDQADHSHALANVENLLADETVETDAVALVANGDAVRALLADAPHADRVAALIERDVEVVACGNSLQSRDLTDEDLLDGVAVGSSGVGELARRQADGYGYVKVP